MALLALMLTVSAYAEERGSDDTVRIGFLGTWDRANPLLERGSREELVPLTLLSATDVLSPDGAQRLSRLRVLFVLNLRPEHGRELVRVFRAVTRLNPAFEVVALDQRDSQAELERAGLLTRDAKISAYWRASGLVNMRRLLVYADVAYLGHSREVLPCAVMPEYGYYHPEFRKPLTDLAVLRGREGWREGAPVAALLIQQSFWITEDTAVIDAEIHALEQHGFNVVALFGETAGRVAAMLKDVEPEVIVEDRHGAFWGDNGKQPLLEELDVPYLRPISMLAYTVEEWLADPHGLHTRDVGNFMSLQELRGTIDPLVVGGLKESVRGFKLHVPIPERIEHFARRAARWQALRSKPNAQKRIAIIYYNKALGQADLMRGSPTGAFLDGPRSLVRFLPQLGRRGFRVDPLPVDEEELLGWIRARGRNLGPWAQGALEAQADRPGSVLIPLTQLNRWLAQKLTAEQRKLMEEHFGPPPGRLMVVRRNGQPHVVLPVIRLGGILLAPQPERGEQQDERLLHSKDVPPPYNYLAFYWWLQEEFDADAVVHWGTHGTLELLPGKEVGLAPHDWSDLLTGAMPIINPWIMDNLGEATLSRRRSYCALVNHLAPASVEAGFSDELRMLHDDIDKFEGLERGLLRAEFRKRITRAAHAARLDETLGMRGLPDRTLSDNEMDAVAAYLHALHNETTPTTLHVLGQAPPDELLPSYLVAILGTPFLERLGEIYRGHPSEREGDTTTRLRAIAEKIVRTAVLGEGTAPAGLSENVRFARKMLAGLRQAGAEVENLLRALEGRYVPPGPGPGPIRNPASLPSGRNLYALNPEEIPTRPSWLVARKLVDELLKTRRPKKVGMDLNGMNTMRDFGIMEGQILYLMGIRPIWDQNGLVVDVEAIGRDELKRPRIDVFIAMGGQYKENFPSRVKLLDKAVRLASSLAEEENGVREGSEQLERRLLARGFSKEKAESFSVTRIFGTKPGNMSGTNILHLVPRSGVWDSKEEITSVYVDSMSYAFSRGLWGVKVDGLFQEAIQETDTLVRVWASNMTSQLSNHHAYEYLGGLSMAVKELTGSEPEAFIADVRDPAGARMRVFEEVLATSLRTELLSPKWIQGMQGHGYAGAGMMAELVKNTFGWETTRAGSVSDGVWNDIFTTYIQDRHELGLRDWFDRVNPHALQEMAATMLEAGRKGYWDAKRETLAELSRVHATSVVLAGPSAGLTSGGNTKLSQFVQQYLDAPGDAGLAASYAEALAKSSGPPSETRVRGPKLEEKSGEEQREEETPTSVQAASEGHRWGPALLGLALATCLLVGVRRRFGGPRR